MREVVSRGLAASSGMSKFETRQREREETRKAALLAKRLEKEKEARPEETFQHFTQQFASQVKAIEDRLEVAKSLPEKELAGHFDAISEDFHKLHRLVSDADVHLASYDLKTSQEQISQLYAQYSAMQDELLPKKKFSFKARPKKAAAPKPMVNPSLALASGSGSGPAVSSLGESDQNLTRFSGKEREHIVPSTAVVQSRDVNLSDLRECEVRLLGPPSTLHMNNLDNCCVLCGPVSSSVFIDNCRNCTFVVACQQLRVHTTVGSVFYLHVTSKAIIEDSKELKFAPYNFTYPHLQTHFQESGLSEAVNNWEQVDDFNWLAAGTHSPNWSVLPPDQRRTSWDSATS